MVWEARKMPRFWYNYDDGVTIVAPEGWERELAKDFSDMIHRTYAFNMILPQWRYEKLGEKGVPDYLRRMAFEGATLYGEIGFKIIDPKRGLV